MSSFPSIPLSGITRQNRGGSSSTIVDSHDRIAVRAPPSRNHENDRDNLFYYSASTNTTFFSLMEIRCYFIFLLIDLFHRFGYFLELFLRNYSKAVNLKLTIFLCLNRFETILKYSLFPIISKLIIWT